MKKDKKTKSKEICGHCVSYDMWCGVCLHPRSVRFDMGHEGIYDYPCCKLFEMEESYKPKEDKDNDE